MEVIAIEDFNINKKLNAEAKNKLDITAHKTIEIDYRYNTLTNKKLKILADKLVNNNKN